MTKIVPIVERYTWTLPFEPSRILDADTVDGIVSVPVITSIPFFDLVSEAEWPYQVRVRLEGVNARELSTEQGKLDRIWALDWFQQRKGLALYLGTNGKRDTFGRMLGDIREAPSHLTGLANALLQNGHAVPYSRELHGSW